MRQLHAIKGRRRGAALLEFAVLLPLILLLFVVVVDFGQIFRELCIVSDAARQGAVYGGTDPTHAANVNGITVAAQAEASDLNVQPVTVTVVPGTDSAGGPCVDVTVQAPFQRTTSYLVPGPTTVSRRVRARVMPTLPHFNP